MVICATVFILLKMILMNRYHLPGKMRIFLYSLKNISKPQISGIDNIGMRSYLRRSNTVNTLLYTITAAFLIFYIVVNTALRQ